MHLLAARNYSIDPTCTSKSYSNEILFSIFSYASDSCSCCDVFDRIDNCEAEKFSLRYYDLSSPFWLHDSSSINFDSTNVESFALKLFAVVAVAVPEFED